ncbi:hypothetical protein ACN263_10670 [Micromonospora sp. WMMD729]|uniref:hypothetical protein n=1 Tax=Micromonospora sp. WMMD729 TaxID=3404127 RepID=UPI003BF498B5
MTRRPSGRSYLLLALLQVGALTLGATPSPAAAVPEPNDSRHLVNLDRLGASDLERAQAPLVALADQIQQRVAKQRLSGFTGVAVDVAARQVTLYWKGAPPAAFIKGLTMAEGVRLGTVAVPYSLAELDREARRIAQENQSTVASVGPRDDFRGLTVAVDREAVSGFRASADLASTIPLTVTTSARTEPASRWTDVVPYWSGNAIQRPVGSGNVVRCSTAFAGKTTSGTDVMVTSYHCGKNTEWKSPGNGWIVGNSNAGQASIDSMLITGSYYEGNMYVGDYQSNQGVPIYGAGNPALNSWVFSSGSHSGASVVQVQAVNKYINLEGVGTVGPGFYTVNTDGVASIGQGDSGGPIAQAVSVSGGTAIYGRGVITGGSPDTAGPCQGVQSSGRQCWRETFHVNIYEVMARWGITIGSSGGV